MLYFIGGPPRCGKTELALRLAREIGAPMIPLDLLWSVLEVAFPSWRSPMTHGAERIPRAAERFAPYFDAAVHEAIRSYSNVILEGELIRPGKIRELELARPVRAVFLLRTSVRLKDLLVETGRRSWLGPADEGIRGRVVDEIRDYSLQLMRECRDARIPVLDVSASPFDAVITEACKILRSQDAAPAAM